MKWEESVMNILEIDNIVGDERPCNNCPTPDGDCEDCIRIRIAKASFKAGHEQKCFETYELGYSDGKRAGMREVVEWIKEQHLKEYPRDMVIHLYDFEDKLKEWGLD